MEKNKINRPSVSLVIKQRIHNENIKNENKYESKNIKQQFSFSPYTCNDYS